MDRIRKGAIIFAHALVGWALCGAIMGIGPLVTTIEVTLVIHAVGAPLIFAAISVFYFRKFSFTEPLVTALLFVLIIILLDIIVVSSMILKNFDMFRSFLGTWLPFILTLFSVLKTGQTIKKRFRGSGGGLGTADP